MSEHTVSEKFEVEEQKSAKQHVVRNVSKDFENEKAELESLIFEYNTNGKNPEMEKIRWTNILEFFLIGIVIMTLEILILMMRI